MILAFGDSLTNGFGVRDEHSYPKQLENKIGIQVINAGVDGEFTSEGLSRLPELLEHKPNLVILCHGANDILNNVPHKEIKNNLSIMITMIKESRAELLLVGVPDYYIAGFEVHIIYEELAEELDVILEDNVLTNIVLNSSFQNDFVHPNEKGYQLMADIFMQELKKNKQI